MRNESGEVGMGIGIGNRNGKSEWERETEWEWENGFPSWDRRGGCAINKTMRSHRSGADGVVRSAKRFA